MTSPTNGIIATADQEASWIRRFHAIDGIGVRLLCFPHAGGSASYFFAVSRALAPRAEVLAVQYPGRQDRRLEPAIESVTELAERVYGALGAWTDRPLAFFGHSMGAIMAFEVARLMQARDGTGPVHLFASGRRAPARYREGTVHQYNDQELLAELSRIGGTDQRFLRDPEMHATVLPVVRSDYRAIESYRYTAGSPLACPITALVGDADPQTTVDEANSWADHTAGGFRLRVFTGGHFYLDAHRAEVINLISATLADTTD
jgi:surfactin synthase thioesterase subunit